MHKLRPVNNCRLQSKFISVFLGQMCGLTNKSSTSSGICRLLVGETKKNMSTVQMEEDKGFIEVRCRSSAFRIWGRLLESFLRETTSLRKKKIKHYYSHEVLPLQIHTWKKKKDILKPSWTSKFQKGSSLSDRLGKYQLLNIGTCSETKNEICMYVCVDIQKDVYMCV